MDIEELIILDNNNAPKDKKRLRAIFKMSNGKTKTIKFGQYQSGGTYADGASDEKRKNYIARHSAREDFNNIKTAGALSRWVLWEFRRNNEIEKYLNRRFKIKKVKVQFKRYNKQ